MFQWLAVEFLQVPVGTCGWFFLNFVAVPILMLGDELLELPPIVFSEIMRDADLFVGVGSKRFQDEVEHDF